jgi:glycopeptide antibiotics resistance protein
MRRGATSARPGGRGLLVALFVLYLVLLAWIVLWKLELPWIGEAALLPRPIKLVPFFPSGDAGASAPLEVLANVLLFVPFGLYLGLLAPSWSWWNGAAVFAGASLILETTQHVLSTGSFDITDVIVNTIGGVAGLGLLAALRRRLTGRTVAVMTRALLVLTGLSLIAVVIFIVSPLHYAQERDVVVTPSETVSPP